jgi:multiple sugar transport system substrate-binding protein
MMTACQSNAGPDVMHQSVSITNGFMKQGLLEPIQGYMKRAGRDLMNEFNPEVFSIVREDDVIYAVPNNASVMALVYNKDMFREAGLTRAPETWAEVYEWAEKLTKRNPDGSIKVYGIAWPGKSAGNIWFRLVPNIWSAGGDVCDPEMKTATMNTQAVKDAVAYYTEVLAKGIAPRSMLELDQSGIQPMFLGGNVAMTIENMTYPKSQIVDKNVFDLGVALWPGKDGPLSAGIGGWFACIPASAKNKEGGAYFIDRLTNAEGQKLAVPLPALKSALDDPRWADPFFEPFKEALRSKSRQFPQFENSPRSQTIMLNLVQSVLTGISTIDDAVDLANEEVQELLDVQNGK